MIRYGMLLTALVVLSLVPSGPVRAAGREAIFDTVLLTDVGRREHLPSRIGVRPLTELHSLRPGQSFVAEVTAVGLLMNGTSDRDFRHELGKFERGDEVKLRYVGDRRWNLVAVERRAFRRIADDLAADEAAARPTPRPDARPKRPDARHHRGAATWHAFGLDGRDLLAELAVGKSSKAVVVDPERLASFGRPVGDGDPAWRKNEHVFVTHMADGRMRVKTADRRQAITLFVKVHRWEQAPARRGSRVPEQTDHGRVTVELTSEQVAGMARTARYRFAAVEPTAEQRRRLMKIYPTWTGEYLNVKRLHVADGNVVTVGMDDDVLQSWP